VKYLVYFVIAISIFTGCSSKKGFEPKNVIDEINLSVKNMPEEIQSFKLDSGITLNDGSLLVSEGLLDTKLPENFNLLNYNDNTVVAVNNNDLMIGSETNTFSQEIVAATLRDNLLALIFIDNSIAIYDTKIKKIVFKDYYDHSFLNDIKIANPYFMDDMILFPTLDGKVIVVDINSKKVIRNIVVSTSSDIKNIIFLGVIGDNFIAASSNKIISIGSGTINTKEYDISSIIASKDNLFVTTIDGKIIKLDNTLSEISSKKFKFAKFFAMVHTDGFVYALESQGYIVSINDSFTKESIYEFEFDNTKYAVAVNNTIYFEDKYLEIK
jgi:hypothetical protein